MPPHLHPRSAATSTLFAGTLLASFIVVGIPHIFPCPRPRKNYSDGPRVQLDENGEPIINLADELQRRKLQQSVATASSRIPSSRSNQIDDEAVLFRQLKEEAELLEKQARECPVPKPSGWIGRALGFEKKDASQSIESKSPTTDR